MRNRCGAGMGRQSGQGRGMGRGPCGMGLGPRAGWGSRWAGWPEAGTGAVSEDDERQARIAALEAELAMLKGRRQD